MQPLQVFVIWFLIWGVHKSVSLQPSGQPTAQPSSQPTGDPTFSPSSMPTNPTSQPTGQPTLEPSRQPTSEPTGQPSSNPTPKATPKPSGLPTGLPTYKPTMKPTGQPTSQPSSSPTSPTNQPTGQPTRQPTQQPVSHPSSQPTSQPTRQPTSQPTRQPTRQPTAQPSRRPTSQPTSSPTNPTGQPTTRPSRQPTAQPTMQPTSQPTFLTLPPTMEATMAPTQSFKGLVYFTKLRTELETDSLFQNMMYGYQNMTPTTWVMLLWTCIFLLLGVLGNKIDYNNNNRVKMKRLKAYWKRKENSNSLNLDKAENAMKKNDVEMDATRTGVNDDKSSDSGEGEDSEASSEHDDRTHKRQGKIARVRKGYATRNAESVMMVAAAQSSNVHKLTLEMYFSKMLDALFPKIFCIKYTACKRGIEELWYNHRFFTIFYVADVKVPDLFCSRESSSGTAHNRTRQKSAFTLTPWLQSVQVATNSNLLLLYSAIILRFWNINNFGSLSLLTVQDALFVMFLCSFLCSWTNYITDVVFEELLSGAWVGIPEATHAEVGAWYKKHRILAQDWVSVDTDASPVLKTSVRLHQERKLNLENAAISEQNESLNGSFIRFFKRFYCSKHYVLPDSIHHLYEEANVSHSSIVDRLFDLSIYVMERRARDMRLKASHATLQLLTMPDSASAPLGPDGRPIAYGPAGQGGQQGSSVHDSSAQGAWSQVTEMSDLVTKLMLQRSFILDIDDLLYYDHVWGVRVGAAWDQAREESNFSSARTSQNDKIKLFISRAQRVLSNAEQEYPDIEAPDSCCDLLCQQLPSCRNRIRDDRPVGETSGVRTMHITINHFLREAIWQGRDIMSRSAAAIASVNSTDCGEEFVGFQLLKEFVVDLLGRGLPASSIYLAYLEKETSRQRHLLSSASKWIVLFLVFVFNFFVIGLTSAVTHSEPSVDWYLAWACVTLANLILEIFFTETIVTWIVHFVVPDFISVHAENVRSQLNHLVAQVLGCESAFRELQAFGIDLDPSESSGPASKPGFSAPEFLYPSVRAARQLLFLPEAAIVASYRSIFPGELLAQQMNSKVAPDTSNTLQGLGVIFCNLTVTWCKFVVQVVFDLLSGALPINAILYCASRCTVHALRLCVRLILIAVICILMVAMFYFTSAFNISGASVYLVLSLAAIYLACCISQWYRARRSAAEQGLRNADRHARQSKVAPQPLPGLPTLTPEQLQTLLQATTRDSHNSPTLNNMESRGVSPGRRVEKRGVESRSNDIQLDDDDDFGVQTSSDEEEAQDDNTSHKSDSSSDVEQYQMLKDMADLLVETERERDEMRVALQKALDEGRRLRAEQAAQEDRVLDPFDKTHKVPVREFTKTDRIAMNKIDDAEDDDPLADPPQFRHSKAHSSDSSASGNRKNTKSSQKQIDKFRKSVLQNQSISVKNVFEPPPRPARSQSELVQAYKKVSSKREELFAQQQQEPTILAKAPDTDATMARLKAAEKSRPASDWRFKMDQVHLEEDERGEAESHQSMSFRLHEIDHYIHSQYLKHKDSLGDASEPLEQSEFEFQFAQNTELKGFVENSSAPHLAESGDVTLHENRQNSRMQSRQSEKPAHEVSRPNSNEHKKRLDPTTELSIVQTPPQILLAGSAETGVEMHKHPHEEPVNVDTRSAILNSKYHQSLLIRPKEAVGLTALNDFETELLEQQRLKQQKRQALVDPQVDQLQWQLEEEKAHSTAKVSLSIMKVVKNILPPLTRGALGGSLDGLTPQAEQQPSRRKVVSRKLSSPPTDSDSSMPQFKKASSLDGQLPLEEFLKATTVLKGSDSMRSTSRPVVSAWEQKGKPNTSNVVHTPPNNHRSKLTFSTNAFNPAGVENALSTQYDESRDFRVDPEAERERAHRKQLIEKLKREGVHSGQLQIDQNILAKAAAQSGFDANLKQRGNQPSGRIAAFAPAMNVHMGHILPEHHVELDGYESVEEELSDDDNSPVRHRRHLMQRHAVASKQRKGHK